MSLMPERADRHLHRLLIVEDSQFMKAYYRQTLGIVPGYEIAFADDGQRALDHLAAQGEPDLILLDINMPVMNGLEFLERHATIRPVPKAWIVIVTTEGTEEDCRRGLNAGAHAYLKKPFEAEQLRGLVARYLGG